MLSICWTLFQFDVIFSLNVGWTLFQFYVFIFLGLSICWTLFKFDLTFFLLNISWTLFQFYIFLWCVRLEVVRILVNCFKLYLITCDIVKSSYQQATIDKVLYDVHWYMDEAARKVVGASQVIFKARLEKVWSPSRTLL